MGQPRLALGTRYARAARAAISRAATPRLAALLFCATFAAGCERSPLDPPDGISPVRSVTAAPAFTGNIRIGVVPAAAVVQIGAPGAWEIVEKATGDIVLTGAGGAVNVNIQTPAQILTIWRLQVICTTVENAAARVAAAEADGYTAVTELAPAGCTRVFIINTSGSDSFASRNAFRNTLIDQGHAGTDSFWGSISQVTAAVLRVEGTSTVVVNEAAILRPLAGHVLINGQPYRGVAEVGPNSTGSLAGINELPIEQYLYGVVPRELPPVPFGEMEAQKAQAVAARTYALRGLGKRQSDGYDLLATTADQVYGGMSAEHPLSSQAVDETAGIAAFYNGALIEALYSSTSGGFTADNEEVFNSAPVAYLRGVRDAHRGSAFENVPSLDVFRNHRNAASLRGMSNGDYEADWSRFHRWTFEWTAAEMSQVISAYAGTSVGHVHAVNVLERGPSGRVLLIEYVTDVGTYTDTKDRIRSSLRFFNAAGVMSSLLSTLFFIEAVTDKQTGVVTGFVAYGGGWGHGVGVSQTGAVGMAVKKATYEEILKHYYRGITLEKAY